jgi:hypothetical protein
VEAGRRPLAWTVTVWSRPASVRTVPRCVFDFIAGSVASSLRTTTAARGLRSFV